MVDSSVLIGLVTAFGLALFHPILVYWYDTDEGLRWIRNDPAPNLFLVVVWPFSVAASLRVFDFSTVLAIGAPGRSVLGIAVLVLLLAFALAFTCKKFFGKGVSARPPSPFWVENYGDAVKEDAKLRKALKAPLQEFLKTRDAQQREELLGKFHALREQKLTQYLRVARPFEDFRDFRHRSTLIAYIDFCLVFVAASFVCVFFWLTLFAAEPDYESAVVVFALLVVWFPLKLYSEWYQHFYSLRELRGLPVIWIVGIGAVSYLVMMLIILSEGSVNPVVAIPAIYGAIGAVLGIIAKFKPEWIWYLAEVHENMPPFYYAFLLFAIALMLGVIVIGFPGTAPGG